MPAGLFAIISISMIDLLSESTNPKIPFSPYTRRKALKNNRFKWSNLPAHRAHIGWVKRCHEKTLLQHLLKLDSERERNLCCDETLEDRTDYIECHHVNHRLKVLFQHIIHHIGISHQVHFWWFHVPIQEPILFVAKVCLSNFE